ncbi:MAG: PKD domain-containing protein [Bacteroidota bacterium]
MREYGKYSFALLLLFFSTLAYAQPSNCNADFSFTQSGNTINFSDNSTSTLPIISWQWDFGDGNFSSAQNPSHTYTQSGLFGPCLFIETIDSCFSIYCDSIFIQVGGGNTCQAQFTRAPVSAAGYQFTSTSTASNPITGYLWDFGDGTFSNLPNPAHAYATPGVRQVCLTITTSSNCTSTVCDTVNPGAGCGICQADFNYSINGPTVTLTDISTASANINSWYWDFGDGTFSFAQNPAKAYTATGTYTICLTITTVDSCVSTYCDSVYVVCGPPPSSCQAQFTTTPDTSSPGTFYFLDQSTATAPIVAYNWDFGDGNNSTQAQPNHTYAQSGAYIACLTILTADSCTSTFCDSIIVNNPCNCGTASFTYTVSGNTVTFTNTSPGCYASSGWIFGDGGSSTLTNPVYTYSGPGTYNVCLCIYDSNNQLCDIVCQTVVIPGQSSCQAQFTATPDTSAPGAFYFFDQSTATAPIVAYSWNFGDGNTSNQQHAFHIYSQPGTYIACLTIFTADSCSSTFCDSLVVTTSGGCNISAGFSTQQIGNTVFFNNQSLGGAVNYFWNFGDGSTSAQANPTYTYSQPGTYTVCLLASSANFACDDTICIPITVGNTNPCNLSANFNATTSGLTVAFSDWSTGGASNYNWYFGDGNFSSQPNPIHAYALPGNYTVCLTIWDSGFVCVDTLCQVVQVTGMSANCQGNANFSWTHTANNVAFTNSGPSGPNYSYNWYFGDNSWGNGMHPNHTYPGPGTYYAVCEVYDSLNNCHDSSLVAVTIPTGPRTHGGSVPLTWTFSTFPNPTGGPSSLRFELSRETKMTIQVYGLDGRIVEVLLDGEPRAAGYHTLDFDASQLPAGIYLYDIRAEGLRKGVRFVKE